MKKNNKKGFTLAELLIVVAIIAVLTAIAIPIFTVQLEKSREETDIANMRSTKAGAVALLLSGYKLDGTTKMESGYSVYFDAGSGELMESAPTHGYGKGTKLDGKSEDFNTTTQRDTTINYDRNADNVDKVIKVVFTLADDDTYLTMSWEAKGAGT